MLAVFIYDSTSKKRGIFRKPFFTTTNITKRLRDHDPIRREYIAHRNVSLISYNIRLRRISTSTKNDFTRFSTK